MTTATNFVLVRYKDQGLFGNYKKSDLVPTQSTVFLSMKLDTIHFTVKPTQVHSMYPICHKNRAPVGASEKDMCAVSNLHKCLRQLAGFY